MTRFKHRLLCSFVFTVVASASSGCADTERAPAPAPNAPPWRASIRLVGGPTALIDLDGARFLTDPTFSPPGTYPVAPGRSLTKLEGPAVALEDVGPVDAVLLSHDQHVDNLDPAGRTYVATAPRTFSTPSAAQRLGGRVTGLTPWQEAPFVARNGRQFRITAAPAQHGPEASESLTGPVTGFLVASGGLPTVYVSGDNASLDAVRNVAARAHVEVAVLFVGAAKSPRLLGDALLTLDSDGASAAAKLLPDAQIVPVHFRGWSHFTQGGDAIRTSFAAPTLRDRLHLLAPGESVALRGDER